VIYSCTELEAKNFGLYLSILLSQLSAWEKDEALYTKECGETPGFLKSKVTLPSKGSMQVPSNYYGHGDYVRCHRKWQIIMRKVRAYSYV
jgi:THO complex subunit 2